MMPASSPPRRRVETASCADLAQQVVLKRRNDLIALSPDIRAETDLAFSHAMPGIRAIVGIDAGGASFHQPEFTAAAASPSAGDAVVDASIMLARTVICVAETTSERDPVMQAEADRG
jgi:hypothetical protein